MRTSYMTEQLLGEFVEERFKGKTIKYNEMVVKRFRPDVVIVEDKLALEFDGYHHYSKASVILRDRRKDAVLKENGYSIIRLPFFIQLDEVVVKLLFTRFNIDCSSFTTYPHGFIDKKALLPADFNELGVEKFRDDLVSFAPVRSNVLASLQAKIRDYSDPLRVIPASLKIDWEA